MFGMKKEKTRYGYRRIHNSMQEKQYDAASTKWPGLLSGCHTEHMGGSLSFFLCPTLVELVQAWLRGVTRQILVSTPMGVAHRTLVGFCVGTPHSPKEAVRGLCVLGRRRLP